MTDIFVPFTQGGALFRLSVPPHDAIALADSLDAMGSSGAAIFDPDGRKIGGAALYGTSPDGSIIISLNLFDTASAEKIASGVYVGAVLNTEQPGLILTDSPLVKGADRTLQKLDGQQSGLAFVKLQMGRADVKQQLRKVDRAISKQGEKLEKAQSMLADLKKRMDALEGVPAYGSGRIRIWRNGAMGE